MKKRLVRKAFDMILGISLSENREVSFKTPFFSYSLSFFIPGRNHCYVVLVMIFLNDTFCLCRTMRSFGRILANI